MQTRQIPLHLPQSFPGDWDALLSAIMIPTEEQLTRKPHISEEIYDELWRIKIDTRALVYAAMHAFSTTDIPKIEFVNSGGFNIVFSLQFGDGFKVASRVARRENRVPGLIKIVAATMTLAKCYSGLPVPEVYAWHAGDDNAVGAPYMLMEWAEGVEAWRKWHELSSEELTLLLNEFAACHAKFAKPLPFRELGSVFFVDALPDAQLSFDDASTYQVGPFLRGPACLYKDGKPMLSQTSSTSLRDFWTRLWQHEMDLMVSKFGSDRSTVIAEVDDDFFVEREEAITLGQFLDTAEDMLTLIQSCRLPPPLQSELYTLGFASTDYALRNIMIDPDTLKITAFLDWDDIYTMPFLLCSRYLEEICEIGDAPDQWTLDGCFAFLPPDEEGEFEESITQVVESEHESADEDAPYSDSNGGDSIGENTPDSEEGVSEPEQVQQAKTGADSYYSVEAYTRRQRIKHTRLRRQYEQLLIAHDQRFGIDGFWEMREEPLKIHDLLLRGWREWLQRYKALWIKRRAQELRELNM